MSETNKAKLQNVTKSNFLNKLLGQKYVKKKLQEQKNFGKNFSIIFFTTYRNIIAVALSGKQIQFFITVNTIKGNYYIKLMQKLYKKEFRKSYNPNLEFNGEIISTGFEYYKNIFNTNIYER